MEPANLGRRRGPSSVASRRHLLPRGEKEVHAKPSTPPRATHFEARNSFSSDFSSLAKPAVMQAMIASASALAPSVSGRGELFAPFRLAPSRTQAKAFRSRLALSFSSAMYQ